MASELSAPKTLAPTIAIDPRLCIGCRACEVACEREHRGLSFIDVYLVERLRSFVPINCRHCTKAPCVTICPVRACRTTPEGVVVIDPMLCIGCKLCGIVCPFGVPEYEPRRKVMVKCDMCLTRLREGKEPVCATTCPTGALRYLPTYDVLAYERREEAVVRMVTAAYEMEKLKDLLMRGLTGKEEKTGS